MLPRKAFKEEFLIPWKEGDGKLKEMGAVYDKNSKQMGFVLKTILGFIYLSLESMQDLSKDVTSRLELIKNDLTR